MTSIAVVQARSNSTRLPGKVLLPLKGFPVAVLAAKRAANTGRNVIVATSIEPSDDALAAIVRRHGLRCFRGSLEDTLARFVDALCDYEDDTLVFRLTADNPLPDGKLLDDMESHFRANNLDYLCCNGVESGLPYGMSAELMRLKHLREAHKSAWRPEDREHVTPFIIRKFGRQLFDEHADLRMGHYRCTIDFFEDYLSVERLFDDTSDPIHIDSLELVSRLVGQPLQPAISKPARKLVVGTAQLGLPYGIANCSGQPDDEAGVQIVRTAIVNGAQGVDTARAYGSSEDVVGKALCGGWEGRSRIVTKLDPLDECPTNASTDEVNARVDASVFRSLASLRVRKIDVLLLHRASHLHAWNRSAWRRLLELRDEGWIGELGVSVQTPAELTLALDETSVSQIQMPFNLLDWRWEEIQPRIIAARAERNLIVQTRSTFLQGLLNSRDACHWARANISDPNLIWNWMDNMGREFRRSSIADLCVGFVSGISWIDGIIIGIETLEQLEENLSFFGNEPLTPDQVRIICETRPRVDSRSLDPSCWDAC